MSSIEFDDEKNKKTGKNEERNLTGFIQDTFGISEKTAKNIILGIALLVAIVSLYFWIQALG